MYESVETEGTERVLFLVDATVQYDSFASANGGHRADVRFAIAGLSNKDSKPRWVNLTTQKRQHYVQDLSLTLWQSTGFVKDDRALITSDLVYRQPHQVTLREAEAMAKTLRAVEARMNLHYAKSGLPLTNAESIRRQVGTFDITKVYVPLARPGDLSQTEYRVLDMKQFAEWFGRFEKAIVEQVEKGVSANLQTLLDYAPFDVLPSEITDEAAAQE